MLPCPKCGHDNELGRIFCHQCGTRLDLNQMKAPGHGGRRIGHRPRRAGGSGRTIKLLVRLVILGALAWSVYLLAQVPAIREIEYRPDDLRIFYRQLYLLEQGVSRKTAVTVNLTEPQIAAYLASFKTEPAEGRGVKVVPDKLQIELGDGVVTTIIVGRITLGTAVKQLSISYSGVPSTRGGKFHVRPVSAAIGQLPIHPLILQQTSLVQNYFKQVFGGLEEKELLDRATEITVGSGLVSLQYQPAPVARAR